MALIFRPDGAPSALVPVSAADDQGNSSIALALAVSLVSSLREFRPRLALRPIQPFP
jgi:hypothetical protein